MQCAERNVFACMHACRPSPLQTAWAEWAIPAWSPVLTELGFVFARSAHVMYAEGIYRY